MNKKTRTILKYAGVGFLIGFVGACALYFLCFKTIVGHYFPLCAIIGLSSPTIANIPSICAREPIQGASLILLIGLVYGLIGALTGWIIKLILNK